MMGRDRDRVAEAIASHNARNNETTNIRTTTLEPRLNHQNQSLFTPRALPSWRSLHFVPANVPKYVEKALTLDCDAIHLDLEDSVPLHEKPTARLMVRETARRLHEEGQFDVVVRVNRPLSLGVKDIEAVVGPDVSAITLTKVHGVSHVKLMDELISECELREGMPIGQTKLIVVVETAQAFFDMPNIATASQRIVAMMLGSEDIALDGGFAPIDEVLLMPKQQMVMAARAAGILPFGYIGTIANFRDTEKFRAMVRRSRLFGFEGGTSIHPLQIPILNEEFGEKPEDVEYARKVIDLDEKASAAGRASFELDGKMIDIPIVERARKTIARFEKHAAQHAARARARHSKG